MSKFKCYIAGPFFKDGERERIEKLREFLNNDPYFNDFEFFYPMEHFIENGELMSNWDWAEAVFNMDVNALTNSDIIIAIYDRHYSDSGTAWELGLAYGLGIPIFLLCTDLNSDNSIMPLVAADEIYDFNKFINGEYFDVDKSKLQNLK